MRKKTPEAFFKVSGVSTKVAPLVPCEGWFGQTLRKRWVMVRSGGFSRLSCRSDPDLADHRGIHTRFRPQACGGQASTPVGLLIGFPNTGPQAPTQPNQLSYWNYIFGFK